jgi:hypothetical protein
VPNQRRLGRPQAGRAGLSWTTRQSESVSGLGKA